MKSSLKKPEMLSIQNLETKEVYLPKNFWKEFLQVEVINKQHNWLLGLPVVRIQMLVVPLAMKIHT